MIFLSLFVLNCSLSPDRYHPAYGTHRPDIRRLLVLPPEIHLFMDGPGGKNILHDSGSRMAGQYTLNAVVQALSSPEFNVRVADEKLCRKAAASGLRALYRSVNRSIQLHAYGPQVFPVKQAHFDYSLGSVAELLDAGDADALVMIMGRQTLSDRRSMTWLSVAIVEPGGGILWYGLQGGKNQVSLRTPRAALSLVRKILRNFMETRS